jgi:hypothetical protein
LFLFWRPKKERRKKKTERKIIHPQAHITKTPVLRTCKPAISCKAGALLLAWRSVDATPNKTLRQTKEINQINQINQSIRLNQINQRSRV